MNPILCAIISPSGEKCGLKAEALLVTIEDIVDTEKPNVALVTFIDALRDTLQQ